MAETETKQRAKPRAGRSKKAVEQQVRRYFEAVARHDVDAIAEHWAEDGIHDVVPIGAFHGRERIIDFFRSIIAAIPDFEWSVGRVVADTAGAAVEWRIRGTFSGAAFQGIEPTGRQVDLRGLDLLEIQGGKITSNTAYYDGAEFARQIGMLPTQDSGAERAMKGAVNAVTRVRKALDERRGT